MNTGADRLYGGSVFLDTVAFRSSQADGDIWRWGKDEEQRQVRGSEERISSPAPPAHESDESSDKTGGTLFGRGAGQCCCVSE
jgi:hypothetical protein